MCVCIIYNICTHICVCIWDIHTYYIHIYDSESYVPLEKLNTYIFIALSICYCSGDHFLRAATCNPRIWESEMGASRVLDYPELCIEFEVILLTIISVNQFFLLTPPILLSLLRTALPAQIASLPAQDSITCFCFTN